LAAYVLSAASKTPHKIALTVYEAGIVRRYSYAQLAQAVFGAATGLRQAGIRADDRVMLRIGNSVDFPVCFLALAALDAIAMPCSITLTDREVKVLVGKTMPKAIICDPEFGLPGFDGLTLDSQEVQNSKTFPPRVRSWAIPIGPDISFSLQAHLASRGLFCMPIARFGRVG
jgi:acyl-CoA synthetase (AMP-forming)/AMP-acid ligase II